MMEGDIVWSVSVSFDRSFDQEIDRNHVKSCSYANEEDLDAYDQEVYWDVDGFGSL
jgi:hypothetical protein